jgi:hypothetical protein
MPKQESWLRESANGEDLLLRAMDFYIFQTRLGEGAELFAGDGEQLGMLRGDQ